MSDPCNSMVPVLVLCILINIHKLSQSQWNSVPTSCPLVIQFISMPQYEKNLLRSITFSFLLRLSWSSPASLLFLNPLNLSHFFLGATSPNF